MFLVDTNVISELRRLRTGRTDPAVAAWATQVDLADQYISVITIQELEVGTIRKERLDPPQGEMLRHWLDFQIRQQFQGRILPVDIEIARRSAALLEVRSRDMRDVLIASTAYVHRMPVVTRNVDHFADTGVRVINPWET